MSFCQLASKAFAFALCNIVSKATLVAFFCINVGLYLGLKVAQGDFAYWVTLEPPAVRYLGSVGIHLAAKVNTDFRGTILMRHPFELRGLYFTIITTVITFLVVFYFGYRFLEHAQDEEIKAKLSYIFSREQVYGVLFPSQCCS